MAVHLRLLRVALGQTDPAVGLALTHPAALGTALRQAGEGLMVVHLRSSICDTVSQRLLSRKSPAWDARGSELTPRQTIHWIVSQPSLL